MFLAVHIEHGDGGEGGTKGGEAENEHGSGVGGVGFVGLTYKHRDDGSAKVLDKEDHGVSRSQTFQGYYLWHTRPESCRSQIGRAHV